MSPAAKIPGASFPGTRQAPATSLPAIHSEPGRFRKFNPRANANADDDKVSLQRATAFEFNLVPVDRDRRVLKVEHNPVLLVQRAHEVAHLRSQNSFHRPLFRRDHMDFDASSAQGGSDLEADEAGAQHNRATRRLGSIKNRSAVGERTKHVYVRLVGAWD